MAVRDGPGPADSARWARDWVLPAIQRLEAYHVPSSDGLVKLDAMENPYPWPADMIQAWSRALAAVSVNRYPDAAAAALKARLRTALGLPEELALLLGNGSDELIQIIALSVGGPGRVIMAPTPTFVMYELIARVVGSEFVGVPLGPRFELDTDAMLAAMSRHRPAVVFLAYPNNPTANLFDRTALEAVIAAAPGLVVIDEAYHVFAGRSLMARAAGAPNLVVMRTLSKLGLAGLRLGFLAGESAWLTEFDKVRLPYNVNVLTQTSVRFALDHLAVFEHQAGKIIAERERVAKALTTAGYEVFPSDTNFLLFRGPRSAERIFADLLARKILIKCLHRPGTALADCLRVTIGTPAENDAFLAALRSLPAA